MNIKKKRILITGAAGFVASHLIPVLVKNQYEVTAIIKSKKEKRSVDSRTQIIVGDLSQNGLWIKNLRDQDIIVHLAAQINSRTYKEFQKNNVIATKNLISAAKKAKVKKIILFSSAAVTSTRQDWYAQTKKQQEKIIIQSNIDYVIIRPSMIYGPGDTKNIGWLINVIKKLPIIPLPGGGHFGRQPVFVDDICKIVIKLIQSDYRKNIFEIHGQEYVTMAKMVRIITKKLGKFKLIFPVPIFFLIFCFWILERLLQNPKFTTDQIQSLISGEKFKGDNWWQTFDIIPTSFEKGIAKMLDDQ